MRNEVARHQGRRLRRLNECGLGNWWLRLSSNRNIKTAAQRLTARCMFYFRGRRIFHDRICYCKWSVA